MGKSFNIDILDLDQVTQRPSHSFHRNGRHSSLNSSPKLNTSRAYQRLQFDIILRKTTFILTLSVIHEHWFLFSASDLCFQIHTSYFHFGFIERKIIKHTRNRKMKSNCTKAKIKRLTCLKRSRKKYTLLNPFPLHNLQKYECHVFHV